MNYDQDVTLTYLRNAYSVAGWHERGDKLIATLNDGREAEIDYDGNHQFMTPTTTKDA